MQVYICCSHPHVDPSQSRHPRAVHSLLLPPQEPPLASPFWKHRSSSGKQLCTVPTPCASPNPPSPCRRGAVSLMFLCLCFFAAGILLQEKGGKPGWWGGSILLVQSQAMRDVLPVPVAWHSQTSCCYLLNSSSIRAPSLIYCPRSPGYAAELPWGWAGSHVVPRLPLPRNLWVDLHVSSPPPAQLRPLLPRAGDGEMGQLCGRRCPFIPRLLALLLVTTGAAAVQIKPVSGVLGGSAQLPLQLHPGSRVKRIIWSFRANASKKIEVVEYNLETSEHPKYNRQRLELVNNTTLQISALELGDSGVYDAQVTYQSNEMDECSFNLTVYEPVPVPLIQHEMLSYSAQDCSIILRCSVPAGSGAQTTWQHDNTSSALWRQSDNSHVLHLTVPASALNVSYTCVARNPAQEKSKSVDLAKLCAQEARRWRWPIYLVVLVAVLGALSIALYLLRRRKAADRAAACPEEPLYSQVQRGDVEDRDEQGPSRTIYSEVGSSGNSTACPQA
uniref:Ig-like domain-containing protein n=1 Tax=Pavo cristatus TaxID=9049 RepID=A0A8C9F9K3_PAVCR